VNGHRHEQLTHALDDLAAHVRFPPAPDLAAAVAERLQDAPTPTPRRRWARWPRPAPLQVLRVRPVLVGVVALVVAAALLLAVLPGPRQAIADLLGIGGVRVEYRSTPPPPAARPAPPGTGLGEPTTLQEARDAAAFPVRAPAALGRPDQVWVNRSVGGGMVSLAYDPRPGLLPATGETGTGLLLTMLRGQAEPVWFKGLFTGTTRIQDVRVGEAFGLWIEGAPHELVFEDPGGQQHRMVSRLAGNTLLWEADGMTYRLEAHVDRDTAVRIATSLR
jgi:hypothetical protein